MDLCRISHFDRENGRVLEFVLRIGVGHCSCHLLHMRQKRVDNIFLNVRLPPSPKVKRKKDDKLQSRNNVVEYLLSLLRKSCNYAECKIFSFIYYVAPLMDG